MSNSHALRGVLSAMLLIGIYLVVAGFQLRYSGRTGPGPGFFPVWIGTLLSLSSLWALFRSFVDNPDRTPFIRSREAATRVGTVLAGLFATWWLLEYLGFRLASLLFAISVPPLLGRQKLAVLVIIAVAISFGTAYVFERWLGVLLPRSSFEFLADLGL